MSYSSSCRYTNPYMTTRPPQDRPRPEETLMTYLPRWEPTRGVEGFFSEEVFKFRLQNTLFRSTLVKFYFLLVRVESSVASLCPLYNMPVEKSPNFEALLWVYKLKLTLKIATLCKRLHDIELLRSFIFLCFARFAIFQMNHKNTKETKSNMN